MSDIESLFNLSDDINVQSSNSEFNKFDIIEFTAHKSTTLNSWEELFKGFNHLKVITFSSSISIWLLSLLKI